MPLQYLYAQHGRTKKQGETHAWPCQFLFLLFNLQKNFFMSEKISFFSFRGLGPGWLTRAFVFHRAARAIATCTDAGGSLIALRSSHLSHTFSNRDITAVTAITGTDTGSV